MSLSYFPLFPDDFEADTAHLTLAEDGAYNRLLRLCWRTPGCKIPSDREWIYRRMRALSDDDKQVIEVVLSEFFKEEKQCFLNLRLMREFKEANDKHKRRQTAGQKGGRPAKPLKNKKTGKSNAFSQKSNAKALRKQPEPEPEPLEKETPSGVSKNPQGSRLPDDWRPKPLPQKFVKDHGITQSKARYEFEKFVDYYRAAPGVKGRKTDWQAAWRSWLRKACEEESQTGQKRSAMRNTMDAIREHFDHEQGDQASDSDDSDGVAFIER